MSSASYHCDRVIQNHRRPSYYNRLPYSTLFRSRLDKRLALTGRYRRTYWEQEVVAWVVAQGLPRTDVVLANDVDTVPLALSIQPRGGVHADRKSTRLNSSHVAISYAVLCLKKKTNNDRIRS